MVYRLFIIILQWSVLGSYTIVGLNSTVYYSIKAHVYDYTRGFGSDDHDYDDMILFHFTYIYFYNTL